MLANIKYIEEKQLGRARSLPLYAAIQRPNVKNFKHVKHENTKASRLTRNLEDQLTIKLVGVVNNIKSDKITELVNARVNYGIAAGDAIRSTVEHVYRIGVDYVSEFTGLEGFITDFDLNKIKEISNVMTEEFWVSLKKNIFTGNRDIDIKNLMNMIASKITVMTLNLATVNKTKQIAMRTDSLNVVPKLSTFTAGKSDKPKLYFFSSAKMYQFLYAAARDYSFFSGLPSLNRTTLLVQAWAAELDDRICSKYDCAINHGKSWEVGDPNIEIPPLHPFCCEKDTEVLTDKGFKLFSELDKTELILSLNPETFDLEYIKPINYIKYKFDGEMIEFSNRWFNVMVTPDHDMFTQKSWDRKAHPDKWNFVKANDIKSSYRFYRSSKWIGVDKEYINVAGLEIPTETFCKFMGYYLSEGSTTYRPKEYGNNERWQISISQSKNLQQMYNDISTMEVVVGKDKLYLTHHNELGQYLIQFGKSYQKYVPAEIKVLSPKYLRIFLDAYCLGDGHQRSGVSKYGFEYNEKVYFTSSERMMSDISELILKVGHVPSIRLNKVKGKVTKFRNGDYIINHDTYTISENSSRYAEVRNMNINRIPYNDYVYCVELPINHTLYVKRNGKCSWVGNCRCRLILAEEDFPNTG